jgi:hypothetical protein
MKIADTSARVPRTGDLFRRLPSRSGTRHTIFF